MQENYKILGVSEYDSDEEILYSYNKLKERYSRERFYEGDIGNNAAKNLTKVENAYRELMAYRKEQSEKENLSSNQKKVEEFIKNKDYVSAQNLLDEFDNRDAEWHYLQSVVFYKKNWHNESKKQLEIACNMDPSNTKYSNAFNKLKSNMEKNERKFHENAQQESSSQNRQMGESNDCCTFCATWCCMDLMCSMCCR